MSLKEKTILLVDDDPDLRKIANHILTAAGLTVIEAESVTEALAIIEKNPPHIILTDLNMPEQTGFDFINILRSTGILFKIPIIVLSSLNDIPNVRKAITLGVSDYVVKPLKASILIRKIRKVMLGKDYIKINLPVPLDADLAINASISQMGEAGFQLLSNTKINSKAEIRIESSLIKELKVKYQLSPLPQRYVDKGNYASDFIFTGINENQMQTIRKWMVQWRQEK